MCHQGDPLLTKAYSLVEAIDALTSSTEFTSYLHRHSDKDVHALIGDFNKLRAISNATPSHPLIAAAGP
jgi:hypothetical protein